MTDNLTQYLPESVRAPLREPPEAPPSPIKKRAHRAGTKTLGPKKRKRRVLKGRSTTVSKARPKAPKTSDTWTVLPKTTETAGPGRLIRELNTLAAEALEQGKLGDDYRYKSAAAQLHSTILSLGLDHAGRSVAFDTARRLYCRARPETPLAEVDLTWL